MSYHSFFHLLRILSPGIQEAAQLLRKYQAKGLKSGNLMPPPIPNGRVPGVGIKGIGKSIKVGLHGSCEKSDTKNMDWRVQGGKETMCETMFFSVSSYVSTPGQCYARQTSKCTFFGAGKVCFDVFM
jgi:hypothetical protein